jgi:O-antigen/teichoic acid export membrane protein
MTVSNVISPMMVSLDRFLIPALLSLTAVSYYATAFEVTIKLLLIPGAVVGVFFPAFAAANLAAPSRASELYDGTMRTMLFLMFPGVLLLVVFAHEILQLWVGNDMANGAAAVMRILAIGVFINALGMVSFGALQGMGRPDLTAKLHVFELPLYAVSVFVLARAYGLNGVAMAWTGRIVLDTTMLAWLMRKRVAHGDRIMAQSFAYLAILGLATVLAAMPHALGLRVAVAIGMMLVTIPLAWYYGLRDRERAFIGNLLRLPNRFMAQAP